MYIGGDPEPMALTAADKQIVDKAIKSVPKGMSDADKKTLADVKSGKK